MFTWMAWTLPTAIFFLSIFLALGVLSVWEFRQPTVLRKGILPFATTRGDRFFIMLLTMAFVHIGLFALTSFSDTTTAFIAMITGAILAKWG